MTIPLTPPLSASVGQREAECQGSRQALRDKCMVLKIDILLTVLFRSHYMRTILGFFYQPPTVWENWTSTAFKTSASHQLFSWDYAFTCQFEAK